METRKIIIKDSATQTRKDIMTNATTFGELKAAIVREGISVDGKDFLEGISGIQIGANSGDEVQLPVNVNYRGHVTNDLVFYMTNTNKKVSSGIDRSAIYAEIREAGLQEEVVRRFGRNYTQVSTPDLVALLEENQEAEEPCNDYRILVNAVANMLVSLPDSIIEDIQEVVDQLQDTPRPLGNLSDDAIDEMFNL